MSGYKLINFKNIDLKTTVATEIAGVYKSIESNYRKPLILEGVVLDGVEVIDKWVNAELGVNKFTFTIPEGTIEVTNTDKVTYTKKAE